MTKLREWGALATLSWLWACGSPEQSTVDQFFRAAQSNDSVTVASMAAVGPPFDELESWQVVEVTSRTTAPFELPELDGKFKKAETEREAGLEHRKKYFEDNEDSLAQIIPKLREDPEYEFRGKLGEIQKEWLALLEDRKEDERVFQEARRVVEDERRLASKSVMRQVPLEGFEGQIALTEILLNLKPTGGEEFPFKATLRKYDVSEPGSDRTEPARWVIASFEGATPEARAAVEAARARGPVAADAAEPPEEAVEPEQAESPAESDDEAAREAAARAAREQRGEARVQILAPETKVEGNDAVTTIGVRNASRGWLAGFTVTEHWYDEAGNVVSSSSRTHRRRFMPGEVIELVLKTRKSEQFYQNQFEFSYSNGDVKAAVVKSLPT